LPPNRRTASTVWARRRVALDLPQPSLPHLGASRVARGSLSTVSQYQARSASSGAGTGTAGLRPLQSNSKKYDAAGRARPPEPRPGLESRVVLEFPHHGPGGSWKGSRAFARHLSRRALSGYVGVRKDFVEPAEPKHWPPYPPYQVRQGRRRHRARPHWTRSVDVADLKLERAAARRHPTVLFPKCERLAPPSAPHSR
jgi:hypothetical protein